MYSASVAKQGLQLNDFEKILKEISYQPEWRPRSQRAADYYDGKQLSQEAIEDMTRRGQPIIIQNLIGPTIDGVLGMEARTRTGIMVKADDDEGLEVSEALNQKMSDAIRLSDFDRACSEAYAAQIKTGLGWVEIRRNSDPFGPQYLATAVHRREVFWDWYAQRPDLSDARWMLRRRWLDKSIAKGAFPKHKDLIDNACNGWNGFDPAQMLNSPDSSLAGHYHEFSDTSWDKLEWLDTERERILISVVYYRVQQKKPVLRLSNGRVIEFDRSNMMHLAAVEKGKVKVEVVNYSKVRVAWYLGPHLLDDKESDLPHNHFPLVPFWGYREDSNGAPYGLVERMIPAQDEVNFRRSKLTWLLKAKRIIMDDDATDMTHDQVAEEAAREDGIIILNASRVNGEHAFRIEQDFNIAAQQFQVMQESIKLIQDTAGVYAAFLGQESGAKSGVAINSLVEQGATSLAEINDNFRIGRKMAAELLLAHIIDDAKGREQVVTIENKGKQAKKITLNKGASQGVAISNDLSRIKTHIVLADIQSTPGYRAQLLDRMMAMVSTLPDDVKALYAPFLIELSDSPNREEALKLIRQRMGMQDPEDMSPDELEAMKQQQAMKAKQEELMFAEMENKVAKLQAETRRILAEAANKERDLQSKALDDKQKQANVAKTLADMSQVVEQVKQLKAQFVASIDQQISQLEAAA